MLLERLAKIFKLKSQIGLEDLIQYHISEIICKKEVLIYCVLQKTLNLRIWHKDIMIFGMVYCRSAIVAFSRKFILYLKTCSMVIILVIIRVCADF